MVSALSDAEIIERLSELEGWQRDGDMLTKTFTFGSYLDGVAFASAVGVISEGLGHHPDMTILWRKVTVAYTTHDAGSKLTDKDFAAAMAIESVGYPS